MSMFYQFSGFKKRISSREREIVAKCMTAPSPIQINPADLDFSQTPSKWPRFLPKPLKVAQLGRHLEAARIQFNSPK
jgi:hypothetical protein